ncbi:hypothetical protein AGOR_G00030190 [Albula goreensis]|uniref:Uncharacterized protein n=1 Tax=Albula goreensis TaxID=1534307 RepID=A0A8T3E644_9TELE|nr:hypothetical protein AGOR_G00030190 [Albula goreensis]
MSRLQQLVLLELIRVRTRRTLHLHPGFHFWALLQCWASSERKQMDLLRDYFWLLVIVGMVMVSTLICIIFIFINKCISRRAATYKTNTLQNASQAFYAESNHYHPDKLEDDLPPLPPRNTNSPSCPSTASYEEIAALPDYVKMDEKVAPPPYQSAAIPVDVEPCPDRASVSTEAYDDVVPPGYDSEDYDDVG